MNDVVQQIAYTNNNRNKIIPVHGTLKKKFGNLKDSKKEKLLLTDEAIYSLSYHSDATMLSMIIKNKFGTNITITDGTANVGGNTLSFAKYFKKVYAIELDKVNFNALNNNIKVYGYTNVKCIFGDCTEKIFNLKQDIIFLDPPWGGKTYKNQLKIDLYLNNIELSVFCNKIFRNTSTNLIILKVPNNFNKESLNNINCKHCDIIQFKKYLIILLSLI